MLELPDRMSGGLILTIDTVGTGTVKYFGGWALALTACCSMAQAATLHVDSFDVNEQGWISGASVVYKATGGVGGGGFLEVESFNNMAARNSDARWTGNYSALGATEVKADLKIPLGSPPMEMRLVLFGVNVNQDRWTSAVAQMVPNDGEWHTYTFPMGADDIVSPNNSGPYSLIMSNVTTFMLRHDAGVPNHTLPSSDQIEGILGIDNVELAVVPEPSCITLVLTAALGSWRRRLKSLRPR
jgi:hypothetical protein